MSKKDKKLNEENKNNKLLEMKDLLQRKQAELENYRKQVDKRFIEIRELANRDIILQLLPIIDNFELALKFDDGHTSEKTFVEGVELIYSQFFSMLENNGVKMIEKEEFNPYYHEALMKVESNLPENTIIEVLQKGFTLHNKVIRPARVKLSAGKKKDSNCDECAMEDCSCENVEDEK
jgi:molecular chaperone GrpE